MFWKQGAMRGLRLRRSRMYEARAGRRDGCRCREYELRNSCSVLRPPVREVSVKALAEAGVGVPPASKDGTEASAREGAELAAMRQGLRAAVIAVKPVRGGQSPPLPIFRSAARLAGSAVSKPSFVRAGGPERFLGQVWGQELVLTLQDLPDEPDASPEFREWQTAIPCPAC